MNQIQAKPKNKKEARDLRLEALKIANATKVDGQDQRDTHLIASGIQRGIELFLRQQSEKARELDKRLKKVKQLSLNFNQSSQMEPKLENLPTDANNLPWILLSISWAIFFIAIALYHNYYLAE